MSHARSSPTDAEKQEAIVMKKIQELGDQGLTKAQIGRQVGMGAQAVGRRLGKIAGLIG